ncbi:MAG TPA: MoxR family ATPase [Planctomycetaceae bacterium]|nr:MoxR family ATPase [Planctomycetaceae bacterium]
MATTTGTLIERLEQQIGTVLLGKPEPIRLAVVSLLAQGHVLVEDAPGVGKTVLAKALARSLDCEFRRLQFTPDLLPSDILGSSVFLPNLGDFEFRRGPIFTNILLADEINRTTPRTQSALLEAMCEGQVSIEGETYRLNAPFFVLATQNPYEYEGTYPLPENQLDRFMMCLGIGYPERAIEREVLTNHRGGEPVDRIEPVLNATQVCELQEAARNVRVDDSINDYLLDIVEATRNHGELELGVSTRGALTFYRAAQAMAFVEGREFVVPDDIKRLAIPVLAHRVICRGLVREGQRNRSQGIIRRILQEIPVPR